MKETYLPWLKSLFLVCFGLNKKKVVFVRHIGTLWGKRISMATRIFVPSPHLKKPRSSPWPQLQSYPPPTPAPVVQKLDNVHYYMASNSSVYIERSDWLVFGRDFTVRTITMERSFLDFFFFVLPLLQNPNCENARR